MAETPAPLKILRALVKGDAAAVRRSLGAGDMDAGSFFQFAHSHRLGSVAYRALRDLGLAGALPPRALAAAKASSLTEGRRGERLATQMRELAGQLERHELEVLYVKGPLFSERFYGGADARGFADLDILLRVPDDVDRVESVLRQAGFEPAFRTLLGRRITRYFSHHFEYRRDSLPLDVHWELQRHFTFAIDYQRVWATREHVTLAGHPYPTASNEYELVLQILGILTDLQVGKLALRSVVDVYRLLETVHGDMDWRGFLEVRARERILRPSVYVLDLVLTVLQCHDRFAALAAILQEHLPGVPPRDPALRAVVESRPLDLGQKLLALRLYETTLPAAVAWWLVSLPFRFAVYGVAPRLLGRGR